MEQGLPPNGACFARGTRITTDRGLETIESLLARQQNGEQIVVGTQLNGSNNLFTYRPATVIYTGKKDTVQLTLENGQSLRVTPDHEVYTENGWKNAGDLTTNDKVMTQTSLPQFHATSSDSQIKMWQMFGWFTGDGWFTDNSLGLTFAPGKEPAFDQLLPVWREFTETENAVQTQDNGVRMVATEKASVREKFYSYGFKEARGPQKRLPTSVFTAPTDCRIAFLQGLFSSDGTKEKKEHTVNLSSGSLELLRDVQLLLLTLGIKGRVGWYPIRKRGHSQGQVRISGESCMRFADIIGFPFNPKNQAKLNGAGSKNVSRIKSFYAVKSVDPAGVTDVYDISEPVTHSLIAEGMVVHNCNLGHQVLPAFVKGDWINGKAYVDWDELEKAVRLGVRFQDNMVDYGLFPTPETEQQQKLERRIGMGTMGLGTMLIMLGLRYGSHEAETFLDKLYSFIAYHAYDASIDIAAEKGPFPAYDYTKYIQSGFVRNMIEKFPDLGIRLAEHGIRNVTILTQAPTGSTGTMIDQIPGNNCSTGIEPYFAFTYWRAGRLGVYEQEVELVKTYREACGLSKNDKLPDFFVTAQELHPEDHVRIQAVIQRWVDSSISKTCNAPNDYTVEDTDKLYLMAYDEGCKGVTIYRDGSRQAQVLATSKDDAKLESHIEADRLKEMNEAVLQTIRLEDAVKSSTIKTHEFKKRPSRLFGLTEKVRISMGNKMTKVYVTVNVDNETGLPAEVFVQANDADLKPTAEALGRMVTQFIRFGDTKDNIEQAVKHLKKGQAYGTLPWHIANLLEGVVYGKIEFPGVKAPKMNSLKECSDCGEMTYDKTNCICHACGASKCN